MTYVTIADMVRRKEQGQFIGRRQEVNLFQRSLQQMIQFHRGELSMDEALFKRIFLVYGEGGMGKTTLLNRFYELYRRDFEDQFIIMKIDWDDYKDASISGSVDIMDILYGQLASRYYNELRDYRKARERRNQLREELEAVRKEMSSAVSSAVQDTLPAMSTLRIGKEAIEHAVNAASTQIGRIQNEIQARLQRRLPPQDFAFYENSQKELSKAFVEGIYAITQQKPVILMMDTYELIDVYNSWVRDGLVTHGSNKIIYVIAGRNNHVSYFLDMLSEEFVHDVQLATFSKLDIIDYLEARSIPTDGELVATIRDVSRGIPLAVKALVSILQDHINIDTVFGDLAQVPAISKEHVIGEVTRRFLKYCLEAKDDATDIRAAKSRDLFWIYTLALLREYSPSEREHRDKLLAAIWSDTGQEMARNQAQEMVGNQVSVILQDLSFRYSFIFDSNAAMHPTIKDFINMALRTQKIPRGATSDINRRAYAFSISKMETIRGEPDDLYRQKEYREFCLDCLNHLLWFDQASAMRFLAKHFVQTMEANPKFCNELLMVCSEDVREYLSEEHRWVIWALENLSKWKSGTSDELATAQRIQGLLSKWLDHEGALVLQLTRAKDLSHKGRKNVQQALLLFDRVEQLCMETGELSRMRADAATTIAETLVSLGRTGKAKSLLERAIELDNANLNAYGVLGRLLYRTGDVAGALSIYEKAQANGITENYVSNELTKIRRLLSKLEQGEGPTEEVNKQKLARMLTVGGNILANEGLLKQAAGRYSMAVAADQDYAQARIKLGHTYRQLGLYDQAAVQFHLVQHSSSGYVRALAYDGLGAVNRQTGELAQAVDLYKSAIQLEGNYANAYNGLGKTYCLLGQFSTAMRAFFKALRHNKSAYWVLNNLGITQLSLGSSDAINSFTSAAALCNSALNKGSRTYLSYFSLGIALLGREEGTEGLLALQNGIGVCAAPGLISEVVSDLSLMEAAKPCAYLQEAIAYLREFLSTEQ